MTSEAHEPTVAPVEALLGASLAMWGIAGRLERDPSEGLVVRTASAELRVSRAPAGLPFRWVVSHGGRERGSGSVVGLLRHVRQALDADYRPARLRIATLPEAI